MRDGLTFLATLVLLALLGALVGPVFVDWNQHRALIEDQLRRATGLDIVTTGPIHLRFLPSPQIKISGLRVGEADPQGTRATASVLRAEMELAPLLKGEIRLNRVALDGAVVTLAIRDGALVLPTNLDGAVRLPAIGQLSLTRSDVGVIDASGKLAFTAPFAIEASLPPAGGPARIEGEVAGRSIRLTTGDQDAAGRLRLKLAISDTSVRSEFDGWLGFDQSTPGRLSPRPDGQIVASLLKAGEAQPLMTLSGRLASAASATGGGQTGAAGVSGLVVELAGSGRLEGELAWPGTWSDPASVTLQSRRLDAVALLASLAAVQQALADSGPLADLMPDMRLALQADQVSYRGEEATEARIALNRGGGVWQPVSGQVRFAGSTLGFAERQAGMFRATLDVPDMRRIALAMQRLEMPQGLAEDIAALGQFAASADLVPGRPGGASGWAVPRWQAEGRFGRASGDAAWGPDSARIAASVSGADVLFLVRPVTALASLVTVPLALTVTGDALRIGDSAPGTARLEAERRDGQWRMDRLDARGFDGLSIAVSRARPGEPLRFALDAARADAISALAERFSEQRNLTEVVRAVRGLSPVKASGVVEERPSDWLLTGTGEAGPLAVEVAARLSAAGQWQGGEINLSARERGILFRALGLPEPARRDEPTRLGVRLGEAGLTLTMSGSDGLSAEAIGRWGASGFGTLAAPMALTFAAPSPAALLPAFAAGQGGGSALAGRAALRLADGVIGLDRIEARLGEEAVTGGLELAATGVISGQLALPEIDLAGIGGWLTGNATVVQDAGWSGARFGNPARLPGLSLGLTSPRVLVPLAGAMGGSFRLRVNEGALTVGEIALQSGSLSLTGGIEAERSGGLLSLRGNGVIDGLDLGALLGGDLSGRGRLALQLGAAAESPARLMAGLTGAGQFTARDIGINRLDPAALERIAQGFASDVIVTDTATLAQGVRRAVEGAPWRLPEVSAALIVSGGVVRLSPLTDDKAAALLTVSGAHDLRVGTSELRAVMQGKVLPKGWTGSPPQIAVTWRGPWRTPARSYDVSVLSNAVAQRALQREIERVDALEADIRERAMFNRRLRADRERREEEQRAAEARLREARVQEEKAREDRLREERARIDAQGAGPAQVPAGASGSLPALLLRPDRPLVTTPAEPTLPPSAAPPLPPPMNINPIPLPMSRQPVPAN